MWFSFVKRSHSGFRQLVEVIRSGLSTEQASEYNNAWLIAKSLHSNFYKIKFINTEDRQKRLNQVKRFQELLNQIDVKLVEMKLKSQRNFALHIVKETAILINGKKFKYGLIVY
ncbi:hypothetical protein M3Y95_00048800 [Aphelenchoides besseyi]|nr:hypothetical protein M3Y95_00048800 [Aphelenchoides besseyi]